MLNRMAVLLLLLSLMLPFHLNAAVFTIDFDDFDDGFLSPPFVGSGSFSYEEPAADGVYFLENLTNFSFEFSFVSGETFTTDDMITPVEEVLIVVSNQGTQVNFANIFDGSPNTPSNGALDFENLNSDVLSFEPGDANPYVGSLYFMNEFFGEYTDASFIPVPGGILLFSSGLLVLAGYSRRRLFS